MAEIFRKGTLYLCATPIGNLEDITYRAVRCLREADRIAAEDKRRTKLLLTAYDIDTPLFSYHEHNKAEQGPVIIERVLQGEMIALVSDAGMPAICDPGNDLVHLALAAGVPVVPLPGANAGLTGLVASGMDTTAFTFAGFLPKTKKHRLPVLKKMKEYTGTLIFYEAPHRIEKVLAEMEEVFGDRTITLCRELTKKHEEYIRGTLSEVRAGLAVKGARGEFVILVAGCEAHIERNFGSEEYIIMVTRLMAEGINKKDSIRIVAECCGVPKREVYRTVLNL